MSKTIKRIKPMPVLLTGRLRLSPLSIADLQDFLIYKNLPEVGRYQYWFPVTEEQVIELITAQANTSFGKLGQWFQFGVHLLTDDQLIGDVGIHYVAQTPSQAEIGYSIAPAYQKQGYGIESVRALLNYVFGSLKLESIKATIDTRNDASRKLLEALGFHQITYRPQACFLRGEWSDEADFSLSVAQWQAK